MTAMTHHYDIIIVGAGLVGASLVANLRDTGLKIAVLEHQALATLLNSDHDDRPISLTHGSAKHLERLDLWPELQTQACPIETVHVSERGFLGAVHFRAKDYDLPALGYVVPLNVLQKMLYEKISTQNELTWITIQSLKVIKQNDHSVTVTAVSDQGDIMLSANYLIGADGVASSVRDLLGISSISRDYQEQALIADVVLQEEHGKIAYERFTRDGVLALLPLIHLKHYRLVWTLPESKAKSAQEWDGRLWCENLAKQFKRRIPIINTVNIVGSHPLKTVYAEQFVKGRCVLIGNAAQTVYPLAAQGFNLGLRDAVLLSQIVLAKKSLQDYERLCKPHQQFIKNTTTLLADLFGLPGLGPVRGLGLLGLDLLSPIKKRFAQRLMGM